MATNELKIQLGLIEEREVAALRGMGLGSLRNERAKGKGPPYQRLGRKVFYPLTQLRAFLAASTVTPGKELTLIDGRSSRRRK